MMTTIVQSLQFDLLHAGYAALDQRWNYDNVVSPFSRMFLVTKGAATLYHSQKKIQLMPGNIYLIPSYVYNRYKCDSYHEQFYISFMESTSSGLSIFNTHQFSYQTPEGANDRELFQRLLTLYPDRVVFDNEPSAYSSQLSAHLGENQNSARARPDRHLETQGILNILLSRFIKIGNRLEDPNRIHDLQKIQIYISENLHRPLSIYKMAQHFNMSSDHFSRTFTQIIGVRPNKYLQERRIERAQLLLLTTNQTISEVAVKTGYDSLAYFSRAFKKITGKSPNSFRKGRFDF